MQIVERHQEVREVLRHYELGELVSLEQLSGSYANVNYVLRTCCGVFLYGVCMQNPREHIAEKLRRRMDVNIVMVGFFAAVTEVVDADALRKWVEASLPAGTEELNLTAFQLGFTHGEELLAGQTPETAGV